MQNNLPNYIYLHVVYKNTLSFVLFDQLAVREQANIFEGGLTLDIRHRGLKTRI